VSDTALADLLRLAAAAGRSLAFNLHRGGKPFGCVMMVRGKVAWAVSIAQPVMLGDFLVRLGHITREQFAQATATFRAGGGRKKLGAVLEELGFVSRPMLRRCLLLHTQEAVRSLLASDDLEIASSPTPRQEDEALLFPLEEILSAGPDPRTYDRQVALDLTPLTALFSLPGYLASAVAGKDGDVLSAHTARSGIAIEHAAVQAAALLEACAHLGRDGSLGPPREVTSRHLAGLVIGTWLDAPGILAVIMLSDPTREAEAVLALAAARPLLNLLADLGSASNLAREALVRATTPRAQVDALRLALELRIGELRSRGEDPLEVEQLYGTLAQMEPGDAAAALTSAQRVWSARRATG
jgi:hypothetical protein